MNLKYKNYILKPSDGCPEKFDLFKIGVTGDKARVKGQAKETNIGYAMSIPSCVNQMVHEALNEMPGTVDFNLWLSEYKKQYDEVKKTFNY